MIGTSGFFFYKYVGDSGVVRFGLIFSNKNVVPLSLSRFYSFFFTAVYFLLFFFLKKKKKEDKASLRYLCGGKKEERKKVKG